MDTCALSGPDREPPRPPRSLKGRAAFSLIEVTLSIGIIAFACVGVFGLLPTGLNTFSRAMEASVGAQIAQRVIGEAEQTDFDLLVGNAENQVVLRDPRYFDDQGMEVIPSAPGAPSAAEKQRIVYWVNTRVMPATEIPLAAQTSGNAALATVTVQVANDPGNRAIQSDAATRLWSDNRFSIATYSALVSRNQ